jgi:hypothetical protein
VSVIQLVVLDPYTFGSHVEIIAEVEGFGLKDLISVVGFTSDFTGFIKSHKKRRVRIHSAYPELTLERTELCSRTII